MTRRPKRSDVPRLSVLAVCDRQTAVLATPGRTSALPPAVILADLWRVPLKVAYSAIVRDVDAGLLEYGVSLAFPWPTAQGMDVLAAGPPCCGGGPQWGHKFDCPRCPD